jgi:hypothetical protein
MPFPVRRILSQVGIARPLKIAWKHPVEGFYQLYKRRLDTRIAKRWPARGVLRRGERWKRVKEVVGSRKPTEQVLRAWKGGKCFTRGRWWWRLG